MNSGFRDRLLDGRRAMAHLIHIWHERNGWSHKVLPALAECLDLGRVHNSQISNLRNGKLASPGPEVFLALGQANALLHEGIESLRHHLADVHPELLEVLLESAIPLIGDDGEPIGAGAFLEIFLGIKPLPVCFDWVFEDDEAIGLSAALAECFCGGVPWRQCRDQVLKAYPVAKKVRRERFAEVIAGIRDYSAEELDGEFLDLFVTYKTLNENSVSGPHEFLKALRASYSTMRI